jgi:hypothetical protein
VDKSILADTPHHPDHDRILDNARAHPERTYSEHVAAAQEIAAESYREEVRRMMKAGVPDPEEDELEGV